MLLRQMQYFVSVVDLNSFTEAAEQNYISQSAISQQIQALEKELGTALIIRENRKFHLSTAGEYFYRNAKELLVDIDKLKLETTRLGKNENTSLKIGYLRSYNGLELHTAIQEFSSIYPEVEIGISTGTHEELYDLLRFDKVDLVLNDQRRAFSDEYINCELLECEFFIEISAKNALCAKEKIDITELKRISCILIASKEQEEEERTFYQNMMGFSGNFVFAQSLEEARLMVVGNRGYLPIEGFGTLLPTNSTIKRIPLYKGENALKRNYCSFWKKTNTNSHIVKFATILCELFDA